LGSKRFIDRDSGGSPFGGEEKKIRLASWVKLLESDVEPPRPATLTIPNVLLSRPTWSARTMSPVMFQTVDSALLPLLGEAKSKESSERYMSSFDVMQQKAESSTPSHLRGGVKAPLRFHMLFAHHATKRVIWLARPSPSGSDGDLCAKASDCSLLVVGPHVVAQPSPAWAAELKAMSDSYVLEELK